jgi:hypothetical protein
MMRGERTATQGRTKRRGHQEYFKDIPPSHVVCYVSVVSVTYDADPTPMTIPISPCQSQPTDNTKNKSTQEHFEVPDRVSRMSHICLNTSSLTVCGGGARSAAPARATQYSRDGPCSNHIGAPGACDCVPPSPISAAACLLIRFLPCGPAVHVGARGRLRRSPLPAGADPAAERDVGCRGMGGAHDLGAQGASRSAAPATAPSPSPGPAQRRIRQGRKREQGTEARARRTGSPRLRRQVCCASARACGAARPRSPQVRRRICHAHAPSRARGGSSHEGL